MFIIVLHQYHRESEDKWKRLSRQIIDLLLPMLSKLQVRTDKGKGFHTLTLLVRCSSLLHCRSSQVNVDSQVSVDVVHRLFEAVAPSVFRPVDFLLKTLFAAPSDLVSFFRTSCGGLNLVICATDCRS